MLSIQKFALLAIGAFITLILYLLMRTQTQAPLGETKEYINHPNKEAVSSNLEEDEYPDDRADRYPSARSHHVASKSPLPFIVGASYDLLKDPEAPKLQRMLKPDKNSNGKNVSCLLEDVVKYPYQDAIKATALLSFPRSGNSWTRSLVEKSTGYASTAVYCEKKRRFVYNCDQSNAFLIKTHKVDGKFIFNGEKRRFSRIVYLVRNPFDSILSYYKYHKSGGNNQKVIEGVGSNKNKYRVLQRSLTVDDVKTKVKFYSGMFKAWQKLGLPTVIVRYEDLKVFPVIVLRLIRRFLLPIRVDKGKDDTEVRLMYHFDDPSAFMKEDKIDDYLQEEMDKLLCAVRTDLANIDLIYETNKFDVLHSLKYFDNSTIEYMLDELREPLCFLKYENLLKDYAGFTCEA